jgi:hypothetical protein
MTKKSVDTIREELRVLNAAVSDGSTRQDWLTPEFVSMVSTVVVNLLMAGTLVGWIDATQAQEISKAVTAILAGVGSILANALIVWKYLGGRAEVKAQQIDAQYRYMESIAVERMRADRPAR